LAYRDDSQWRDAYSIFASAIDTVESLRGEIKSGDEAKQKLAEEWNKLYQAMVETCLELQQYAEAVEYADRSKTRNLVELIATRDLYPKGKMPAEVSDRLQELSQQINQEDRRLAAETGNKDYTQLNQWRAEYNQLFPYKPISFAQIQSLLDADTAILEWYIFRGDCFRVFVITSKTENEGVEVWTSSKEDLENLVNWASDYLLAYYAPRNAETEAEREELQKAWQDSMASRLQELATILHIDEILGLLPKNIQRLILIPHRLLHLFPLHALEGKRETDKGTKAGCLLELFPGGVSYAPSCQLLHQARAKGNCDSFFGIQNPTNDLAWAELEVAAVRQAFPRPSVLPGKDATKSALLENLADLEAAHCLHFSCHGAFNPFKPLESGLQLADAPLTLEDIFRHFNLAQCSLVTLSACETGMTDISNSDEYISLASGFMAAGSPSLAVSLWSVNAASAALLFVNFYDRLLSGSGKIALSLNQAQLWLRDATVRELYDWVAACRLFPQDWREILQLKFNRMAEKDRTWEGKPYQSPYHWAAFCAVGLGEQRMVSSSIKLEAFRQLIEQNQSLLSDHWPALTALVGELSDSDEESAVKVEAWLEKRSAIRETYDEILIEKQVDSLDNSGEKLGGGTSGTNPNQPSQSLSALIGQAVKQNSPIAKKEPEKPAKP
jgi:CHAT domain-containing protein